VDTLPLREGQCHTLCIESQTHKHACLHATHARTHAYTHIRTHAYTHAHTHAYTHAHTHMHTHMHARVHTCTHANTHAPRMHDEHRWFESVACWAKFTHIYTNAHGQGLIAANYPSSLAVLRDLSDVQALCFFKLQQALVSHHTSAFGWLPYHFIQFNSTHNTTLHIMCSRHSALHNINITLHTCATYTK